MKVAKIFILFEKPTFTNYFQIVLRLPTQIALHLVQLPLYHILLGTSIWEQKLQNSPHSSFLCPSFFCNLIGAKKSLEIWLVVCFSVPFSLAGEKVRFRAERIRELIALQRADQIARITSDFEKDVIKVLIFLGGFKIKFRSEGDSFCTVVRHV